MSDYTIYDGVALKKAFDAAHAGMEAMVIAQPSITQANLDSAREFIETSPLFANFKSETPVNAATIKHDIATYLETRPDQDMDPLTATLINRWVIGFEDGIKNFDDPNEGMHPVYGFPMPVQPAIKPR